MHKKWKVLHYQTIEDIWFSHIENIYDAELKLFQGKSFRWTERTQMWDWSNRKVSWVRRSEIELRVVIRSL